MAIQVSYLESKLAPDWGTFSKAFPHKSAQETVKPFKGDWDFPAIHRSKDGSWQRDPDPVKMFKGDWDFPAIHRDKDGTWQREPKPVDAFVGEFTTWPRIAPIRKGQPYQDAVKAARSKLDPDKVEAAKGGYPDWPRQKITPKEVKSVGKAPLVLPAKAGAKDSDGWAELGQIYFTITINGQLLGRWQKLEGLGFKMEVADYRAGDGDNYRWYEPSFTSFTNIKLTRASSERGTAEIRTWLTFAQFQWKRGVTAVIEAKPLWKNNSVAWRLGLRNVMPVAWTGPSFNAEGKVATETLEIAHSGFIDPHGGDELSPPGPLPTGMPKEPDRAKFTAPPLPGARSLESLAKAGGYGLE